MRNFLLLCLLFGLVQAVSQTSFPDADTLRSVLTTTPPRGYKQLFADFTTTSSKMSGEEALKHAREVLRVAEGDELGTPLILFYANKYLGDVCARVGKKGDALIYLQRARTVAKENNLVWATAFINLRLGKFYLSEEFLAEASESLFEANAVFEKLDDTLSLYDCYYTALLVNYRANHNRQAIEQGRKVVAQFDKIKNKKRRDSTDAISAYNTMGLAAIRMNDFESAMNSFQKAEDLATLLKHEFWIGLINGNRAKIYRAQGLIDLAIKNLKTDFQVSVKFKQWASAVSGATTLADIFVEQKKWKEAKYYLDTSAILIDKVKENRVKLSNAKVQARYYQGTSNLAKAFKAQSEAMRLTDSLMADNEQANLGRFRARYELEEKKEEIDYLQHSNELQKKEIKTLNIVIWSAVIILSLVILLIVVIVKDSQRLKLQYAVISSQRVEIENKNEELEMQSQKLVEQNKIIGNNNQQLEEMVKVRTVELEKANEELDQFLYHASHDIRRPIATLLGLSRVFQLSATEHWQSLFEKVAHTALNMDNMLFKLQMAHELNKPVAEKAQVDLYECIQGVADLFNTEFQTKGVDFILVRSQPRIFQSHIRLIQIILRNLIENAICFKKPISDERPYVRIITSQQEGIITIEVEDNGIGIAPAYHERIFDLYFRGTQQSKGNGLGLYLAKKAVLMLKGQIHIKSKVGEGAVFTVSFPIE